MVDPQDEYYDRRLAAHLVGLYYKTAEQETGDFLVTIFQYNEDEILETIRLF